MRGVERGRLLERSFLPQFVGAEVGVAVPQLLVLRELVEHPAPLAVPLRVLRAVEHLLGHVAGADDRARHDARDLPARPCKTEDVARKNADALPRLLRRSSRLRCLRVVDNDKLRANRPPVGALVLHASDAPGDAGDADYCARGRRARNCRDDDLARSPRDARPLTLVELPCAAIRYSLQSCDGVHHLREVLLEMLVDFKFRLDGVEHFKRSSLACADDDDELAVSVSHSPDRRRLG